MGSHTPEYVSCLGAGCSHCPVLTSAVLTCHDLSCCASSRRPYSREEAAFPAAWVRQAKFWPTTSR